MLFISVKRFNKGQFKNSEPFSSKRAVPFYKKASSLPAVIIEFFSLFGGRFF